MSIPPAAWLALVAVVGLAGPAEAAGSTRMRPPLAEESTDAVVRVTAVVTDRRGQPLPGLTPSDFDVLVDGKPQPLDTVELSRPGASGPRTFAILLDEYHTAASDSLVVRESLLRFVDHYLKPGDLALVVKPLDPLTRIQPTADRSAIRQAISTFEGRKGDYAPRTAFERNYLAQAPNAVAWARAQIVTSALRAIGMSLGRTSTSRPAIVLVSDGFARIRSSREIPANLQTAIRVANRADAPVYAFTPALPPPADPAAAPDQSVEALSALTAQTGGELISGAPAFEAGFARMTRDLDAHYVLTYRPAHGSDGRFHSLQVGIKRAAVQIRTRGGYVAPMSEQMRAAAERPPSGPLRVLRRSPLIQTWSGVFPTTPGRANVVLTWEPAALRAGSPARGRAASIVVTASAVDGTVLFDAQVQPVGSGAAAGPDHARFEAAAGPVRVDVKVLDSKGVVIDTDARDLLVPGPRPNGPTIFPPAVLRTRSAREFREISRDAEAAPVPARDFRRTERLLVRVAAIDSAGLPVPVKATLLNRLRQPIRDVEAFDGEPLPGLTQFDLPLSALVPGDYALRLSVEGPSGPISEFLSFRVGG